MKQEGGREVTSGRVPREQNLAFIDSERVDKVLVSSDSFDELRRVLVLGCETWRTDRQFLWRARPCENNER
jgi:hypothetical protein